MERAALALRESRTLELSVEPVYPTVVSVGYKKRKRRKPAPIDINGFIKQDKFHLGKQESRRKFEQFRNAAHVTVNAKRKKSHQVQESDAPAEKPLPKSLPPQLFQLLNSWAAYFGHQIHLDKGYIYYRGFHFQDFLFIDAEAGLMKHSVLKERYARLYFNLHCCGHKFMLKACNHLKGIEVNILSELAVFHWLRKQSKFNTNLENIFGLT